VPSFATRTPEAAPRADLVEAYEPTRRFFDEFVQSGPRWKQRNRAYHELVASVYRFLVAPRSRVLEIGAGDGDLLAAVEPEVGVGVDLSQRMVDSAQQRHPDCSFHVGTGEELAGVDETPFDYILLSDVVPYVFDLLELFARVREHSHASTRVIINSYNPAWRPLISVAERVHLKPRKPIKNWVSPSDVANLLELSGMEILSSTTRILFPKHVPFLTTFFNGFVASLWPFNRFCVSYWIVARPRPLFGNELETTVSVVCPCRNESGHIERIVERLPLFGKAQELIFVEGGSTDDTRSVIEQVIESTPDRDMSLLVQSGVGKGDAVRTGFAAAKHEVLMILDGDLSVRPEDLPKFYDALISGRGELINGSRLVYDMEPGAMRFLNMLGNKAFSSVFKAITGHHVKDTLCGTKVVSRTDYTRIGNGRSYFGDFDPFGDFDLLFGAARLNLKIVDLPVRYQPRSYGTTNISRFSHGLLLLRMSMFAFWKFRVAIFARNVSGK
jgi:2-polyprenyl-3-methyl-5-hydroxy-6-metoxy-1,4-benzoquinol methylase